MKHKFKKASKFTPLAFLILFSSCGPSTNLNKAFVRSADSERYDHLVTSAWAYYDEGNFDKSEQLASKANQINPNGEDAALALSYSYLAKAGIEPFGVIEKLNEIETTNKEKRAAGQPINDNALVDMADLIELSETDITALGSLDGLDTDPSLSKYFAGLPVYIPNTPGNHQNSQSPRYTISTLRYINKAILTVCPFLSDLVYAEINESSFLRYDCPKANTFIKNSGHVYLVNSLAHLVESIAFNLMLLYEESGEDSSEAALTNSSTSFGGSSNLLKRVNRLSISEENSEVSISEIVSYTAAVLGLKNSIDAVFDLNEGSMLSDIFVNLEMIVASFSLIPGVPDSVTGGISDMLASIKTQAETIKKGSNDNETAVESNKAAAQQLNKEVVNQLNSNVSSYLQELENQKDFSEYEQAEIRELQELCGSMDLLTADVADLQPPSSCDDIKAL